MSVSRYRNSNTVNDKYYESFNMPSQADIDQIPTIQIVANKFDRLDNLAHKYLGDGQYWWVIAIFNNISWAFNLEEGQVLSIPTDMQQVLKLF